MKVLWFVNKPPARLDELLGQTPVARGSWIDALEALVRREAGMELSVAVQHSLPFGVVQDGAVRYIGMPGESRSGIRRVLSRHLARSDAEILEGSVRAIVENESPDLIHVHGTERPYGMLVASLGVPWLVTLQGILSACEVLEMRGWDAHARGAVTWSERVRGVSPYANMRTLHRRSELERQLLGLARVVTGRTTFDRDFARLVAPQAAYVHVDEPLRSVFHEARWAGESHGVLFAVGGNYSRKGLGDLLEAVATLRSRGWPDLVLRVCGIAREAHSARAIAAAIRAYQLSGAVTVLPDLSATDLATELAHADAYVHPTHVDNSPNSLCEALSMGVPCVATRVGGIPSLVTDGVDAVLVGDDSVSLAGGLARLLSNRELSRRISRAASKNASSRHDVDRIVDSLHSAYRLTTERSSVVRRARGDGGCP